MGPVALNEHCCRELAVIFTPDAITVPFYHRSHYIKVCDVVVGTFCGRCRGLCMVTRVALRAEWLYMKNPGQFTNFCSVCNARGGQSLVCKP